MEIQNNAKALLTKYAVIENLRPMILLHAEMLSNITKAKKLSYNIYNHLLYSKHKCQKCRLNDSKESPMLDRDPFSF